MPLGVSLGFFIIYFNFASRPVLLIASGMCVNGPLGVITTSVSSDLVRLHNCAAWDVSLARVEGGRGYSAVTIRPTNIV